MNKPRGTRTRNGPAPRALLIPWLAALLLLLAWNLFSLQPHRDLSLFLPKTSTANERLLLNQLREGVAARTLLIGLSGQVSTQELAESSKTLTAALTRSGHFLRVAKGNADVDLAGLEPLFDHRYLLGPQPTCADALTETGLRAALQGRLGELASPLPPLDKVKIPADPTGCFRETLLGWLPPVRPRQSDGVWFSHDLDRAILFAETRADGSDLPAQIQAVASIRDAFAALPRASRLHLDLTGPAYFAVGSQETISGQTTWLSLIASLLVALLFYLAFRSLRLVLLGILPLLSGILVGITAVTLIFGSIHGIALALGITLLGVGMDYPVHIFTHAKRRAGSVEGLAAIGPSLTLAAVTTAAGYGALSVARFEGLAQLGVLAAAGLATTALCSRFLLPWLLPHDYSALIPQPPAKPSWSIPALSWRWHIPLILLAAGLMAFSFAVHPTAWSSDLSRLSSVPRAEIALDQRLRGELGVPEVAQLLFVLGDTPEAVLIKTEGALSDLDGLVKRGIIGGFEAASRLLPSIAAQRARQNALPGQTQLAADLAAAETGLGFRSGAFAPFLADIERTRSLAPLTLETLAGTPLAERLIPLLHPFEGRWIGVIPLMGADHPDAATALRALTERLNLQYLDMRDTTSQLIQRFIDETLDTLLITALLIALLILAGVRHPGRIGRVLLPVALALVLDVALLRLTEGPMNLFHLVSLLLVMGLAIDYSLFFSRTCSNPEESRETLFGVGICALSTFAMFGLLAFSTIPVLHAIGLTVALGVGLAFLLTLLLSRDGDTV